VKLTNNVIFLPKAVLPITTEKIKSLMDIYSSNSKRSFGRPCVI